MAKRCELSVEAWDVLCDPFIKTHGLGKPRLNDRLLLNGVFWVLPYGAVWRAIRCVLARCNTMTSLAFSLKGCDLTMCREGSAGFRSVRYRIRTGTSPKDLVSLHELKPRLAQWGWVF